MAAQPSQVRGRGRPRDESARKRILRAALELMDELAYSQVTAEAIAERAGASKTKLYRWWPNKAAIVIEAFREAVAPQLPFEDTGRLLVDLTVQVRNFARMMSGPGGRMLRSLIVAARSDPEVAAAFRTLWSDPRRAEAKAILRRKQSSGQMRKDVDLDLVLDSIYGPLYYRFLVKNELPSQKYAANLVNLVVQGLAPG